MAMLTITRRQTWTLQSLDKSVEDQNEPKAHRMDEKQQKQRNCGSMLLFWRSVCTQHFGWVVVWKSSVTEENDGEKSRWRCASVLESTAVQRYGKSTGSTSQLLALLIFRSHCSNSDSEENFS